MPPRRSRTGRFYTETEEELSSVGSPSVNARGASVQPQTPVQPRVASPEVPPTVPLPPPEMYQTFIATWMAMQGAREQTQIPVPPVSGLEIRVVMGSAIPRGYRVLYTVAVRSDPAASSSRVMRRQRPERAAARYMPWSRPEQGATPYGARFVPRPFSRSVWCRNCSSEHPPPCRQPIRCYSCGRIGHRFRQCPRSGASRPLPHIPIRPPAREMPTFGRAAGISSFFSRIVKLVR